MRSAACVVVLLAIVGCQKREQAAAEPAAAICASDADCVFSCAAKDECCDRPVCDLVLHKQAAAAVIRHNNDRCTDDQRAKCPAVEARAEPGYVLAARCTAGTCVAEKLPKTSAAWQNPVETVSAVGFDRSCQTVDDCQVVDELPCNHCNCGSVAIAVKELERWNQAAAAIRCGPQPKLGCTSCNAYEATCEGGVCGAKQRP
jgi:hypothetical protein